MLPSISEMKASDWQAIQYAQAVMRLNAKHQSVDSGDGVNGSPLTGEKSKTVALARS